MMATLQKIAGLVWYEMIFYWRRRTLAVVVGCMLLAQFGPIWALGDDLGVVRQSLQAVENPSVRIETTMVLFVLPSVLIMIMLFLVGIIPILVADAVPRDRQLGVQELLYASPLTPGMYLAVKLVGMMASVAVAVGVMMVAGGVVWPWVLGGYDVGLYVELWVVGGGVLVLLNPGLMLLLAAGQPSRRRAFLVAVAATLVELFLLMWAMTWSSPPRWWVMVDPIRTGLWFYFQGQWGGANALGVSLWPILLAGLLQLALAGLWARYQQRGLVWAD